MELKFIKTQVQKQNQKLSYRQRLEIEILEISTQDLQKRIQDELESNPCLEQDMLYETGHSQKEEQTFNLLLNYVVKEKTLSEELQEQIRWCKEPIHTDLAFFIADMLNENGYLTYSNDELLKYFPQYSDDDIEQTIHILQTFEPAGVCARNLVECLCIQLNLIESDTASIAKLILQKYINDLAEHHIQQIASKMHKDPHQIQEAFQLIQSLNPKPGANYSNTATYLYPDFFCYIENDEIKLEMMNETYGLYIVNYPDETDSLIKKWKKDASILISAIKKRNSTLYKIVSALCNYQKSYFLYSLPLKPCTLKTIAQIANVHESTISRCVANKSLIFKDEVIPLKYFFPKAIDDDNVTEILDMIKAIIKKENPLNPLSDQEIVLILKDHDYYISRRTVAKYRNQLHIPSSSKRKQCY